ncbi:toprim domain-containing protein [Streptomyces sp. MMS24-I29]|uniref:toprim domain-containing protein n=1 Tax=Streptomyces sp. MMS24-I29 TaxID=3351480 RepID=UPI003C7DECE5
MTATTGQPHHGPVVHLADTPPGLTARFVQRTRRQENGTRRIVRTGGRRLRDTHVDLQPSTPPDPAAFDQLLAFRRHGDRSFILGASTRTWTTVKARFGDDAWPFTVELIRAGTITLRCEVTNDLTLGAPTRWYLTTAGRGHARLAREARDVQNQRLAHALQRARADIGSLLAQPGDIALDDLQRLDEALARELDRPVLAHKRIALLTALADDLCQGTRHTSTRAFSLAHTRNTKTWDDALHILRESGVPTALAQAIGLRGHSRIGLGGPITAMQATRMRPLDDLGVVLIPATTADLHLELRSHTLIVVENLQAADAVYRALRNQHQPPGIVYHAGMPSQEILHHIAELAEQADNIIIAPDADLGGTRIATAIWNSLTPTAQQHTTICDIGLTPTHTLQNPWAPNSPVWQDLHAMLSSPAGALAQECLRRGYPVEQEGCIVETVLALLNTKPP